MKRLALIAGAAVVLLSGIGAGAYFYLMPPLVSGAAPPASHLGHQTETSVSGSEIKAQKSAELRRLLERLGTVQDRVVRGDHAALADQGRLLTEISDVLRHFEKRDWDNYANIRGAFVYVLSGGDYGVLKPLADDEALYEADRTLAQGIMQFAQGRTGEAKKLLSDLDPRSLDISLVGPFALAQASFYIGHDDAKAIELLDEARLVCPHTAIEEAAARREIPILIGSGDTGRAMMLMSDYLRRFGKSIYAWKLFRDFSAAAAKRDEFSNGDLVDKLDVATSTADKQARIDLFLAMAGAALPPGRIALAKAAAGKVLSLKPESIEDIDRATLYGAAAKAPTTQAAEALSALHQITIGRFSGDDAEIHEVAGYVAHTVTRDKIADIDKDRKTDERANQSSSGGGSPPKSQELSIVANAVESADAALKEADMVMSGNVK
jgi:chemotaxis protein MotC